MQFKPNNGFCLLLGVMEMCPKMHEGLDVKFPIYLCDIYHQDLLLCSEIWQRHIPWKSERLRMCLKKRIHDPEVGLFHFI
jgi:hypothetical protein